MLEKYRFNYEEVDFLDQDEMLWVFPNLIVGVSYIRNQFKINHYPVTFDKSNYEKVEMDYSLDRFTSEYMRWVFDIMEEWKK